MLDAIEWAERSITIELHLLTGISEQVRNDVPGLAALQERPLDRPSRWVQCALRRLFFLTPARRSAGLKVLEEGCVI